MLEEAAIPRGYVRKDPVRVEAECLEKVQDGAQLSMIVGQLEVLRVEEKKREREREGGEEEGMFM